MAAKVELPFLYQTRTIFRAHSSSHHLCTFQRSFGRGRPSLQNQQESKKARKLRLKGWIRTTRPNIHSLGQPLPDSITSDGINISSKTTLTEPKAFETILLASKWSGRPGKSLPLADAIDLDVDNILQLFGTARPFTSLTESGHDQLSSASNFWPPEDNETVISGIIPQRMHEIANALQSAAASTQKPGDLALWHACEAHIFPLGEKLRGKPIYQAPEFLGPEKFTFSSGHSDVPSEILKGEKKRHRAKFEAKENDPPPTLFDRAQPVADARVEGTQEHIPDSGEARAVVHHIYPAALLYALRLFERDFPSSPFAFNLLPRIRELGHTSYVLGASTQFYNSLMSLSWRRNSSLREIHNLLSEMDQGFLEYNEETYRIVHHIVNERETAMIEETNEIANLPGYVRNGNWWRRHEQAFWYPKIVHWLNAVAEQLSQPEPPIPTTEEPSQTKESERNGSSIQPSVDEIYNHVVDDPSHSLKQT